MDKCNIRGEMNPEILIIGAAILDILVRPVGEDVFRMGSYNAEDIRMSVGADALNEATILAKMGKRMGLETVIGKDKAGKLILDHCHEQGIMLRDNSVKEGLSTGINVVLVEEDGRRSFLTNPHGSLRKLRLEDIPMPFPESAKIICFASLFVFPEIRARELEILFSQVKKQNKILCVDMTKCKNHETAEEMEPALRYVDYLFPNDEEALLLTGHKSVEEAAEVLLDVGVKHVVIKCGARGCYIRTAQEKMWIPAAEGVKCVDTTGAGDSFAAGFMYALSEGQNLKDCAQYANICGGKAVEVMGATEWI